VAVAEPVIVVIDRDRDRVFSENEAAAYTELLKRDLTLRIDGRDLKLRLTASEFVEPTELRTGSGTIQLEFSAILASLATGFHWLKLENRYLTTMSVYLINASQPSLPRSGSPGRNARRTRALAKSNLPFIHSARRLLCPARRIKDCWVKTSELVQRHHCHSPFRKSRVCCGSGRHGVKLILIYGQR
jgi:hypothetical protein